MRLTKKKKLCFGASQDKTAQALEKKIINFDQLAPRFLATWSPSVLPNYIVEP